METLSVLPLNDGFSLNVEKEGSGIEKETFGSAGEKTPDDTEEKNPGIAGKSFDVKEDHSGIEEESSGIMKISIIDGFVINFSSLWGI